MENKNEINVLDELNKGARMGMDAIHFILPKVTNDKLRDELNNQRKRVNIKNDTLIKLVIKDIK